MAENSIQDKANRRQKLGLVWRNRKKISQIIKDYFCLPFFLLIILCYPHWSLYLSFDLSLSDLWIVLWSSFSQLALLLISHSRTWNWCLISHTFRPILKTALWILIRNLSPWITFISRSSNCYCSMIHISLIGERSGSSVIAPCTQSHSLDCSDLLSSQLLLLSDTVNSLSHLFLLNGPHSHACYCSLIRTFTPNIDPWYLILLYDPIYCIYLTPAIAFICHSLNCFCPIILTLTCISHGIAFSCYSVNCYCPLILNLTQRPYLYLSHLGLLLSLSLSPPSVKNSFKRWWEEWRL